MQLCTFRIGTDLYGIDVLNVQEVVREQEVTRVPLSPPEIHGLMNLRGSIVSTIDMRERLRLKSFSKGDPHANVIVQTQGGIAGLMVDQIGEVLSPSEDRFEAPPASLRKEVREMITGVAKLDEGLLLVLDPKRIIKENTEER